MTIKLFIPILLCLNILLADEELSDLPTYQIATGVSGNLYAIGSDTMVEVMTYWAEAFRAQYPDVSITLDEKGSNTAPPALLSGESNLAPMSRPMTAGEISAFTSRYGYPPTEVIVAIDALSVFVHRENPLQGLTLQQVERLFSAIPRSAQQRLTSWDQLPTSKLERAAIKLYGRNPLSGTYSYFKKNVLHGDDFAPELQELPTSKELIDSIATDTFGIAYCGISYQNSGVRTVPIGATDNNYYPPTVENCLNDKYPIARKLYIYINKSPHVALPSAIREFLRFALSRSGQEVVISSGLSSLPLKHVTASLQLLGP